MHSTRRKSRLVPCSTLRLEEALENASREFDLIHTFNTPDMKMGGSPCLQKEMLTNLAKIMASVQ